MILSQNFFGTLVALASHLGNVSSGTTGQQSTFTSSSTNAKEETKKTTKNTKKRPIEDNENLQENEVMLVFLKISFYKNLFKN